MNKAKVFWYYFTTTEKLLWVCSVILVSVSYFAFEGSSLLSYIASLVGVCALIFCAKGNPIGQTTMIVFDILYAVISYTFSYYGEMMTYLGLSMPMSVISLVSWLKNPYRKGKAEVKIKEVTKKEICVIFGLTAAITFGAYFVLRAFGTANLLPSTFSVATSFLAVSLMFRRSPYFALGYAVNDVVLIILWVLASLKDISYLSVVICFTAFLMNDLYSFCNWRRMQKKQSTAVFSEVGEAAD